MIITSDSSEVTRVGVQTEQAFKIKASRRAFQILSSGLYSDKQTAIVRELLANAWDSHVAAHNLVSVSLHLPNSLEPWLSIRDFGTGLSDEQIKTVYTTYFESTKTGSNDFTGCLGLGSKSPFSYVDNFTVVSYFDRVKRTYSAFIDENGFPAIAGLGEEPTTEHNGMEVQIAVKSEDFEDFRLKTQKVIRRFRGKVDVVGNGSYSSTPIAYSLRGSGWALRDDSNDSETPYALMGNIGYPIKFSDSSLSDTQRTMLMLPIDIDFAIGELDIAASREALSYDVPTINNIKTALNRIVVELRDRVAQEFTNCQSLWQARCLAQELFTGKYKKLSYLVQGSQAISWRGQAVAFGNVRHNSKLDVSVFTTSARRYGYSKPNRIAMLKTNEVTTSTSSKFIYDDLTIGSFSRCKKMISDGIAANVYLFRPSTEPPNYQPLSMTNTLGAPITPAKPPYPTAQEQLAAFKTNLGLLDADIVLASSLPKNPRQPRTLTPQGAARVLVWNGGTSYTASKQWDVEPVDIQQGGIYVALQRYDVLPSGRSPVNPNDYFTELNDLMSNAGHELDLNKLKIVGVKQNHLSKFNTQPQWTTLDNYCKKIIEGKLANAHISDRIAISNDFSRFSSSYAFTSVYSVLNETEFKDGGAFRNFLVAYKKAKAAKSDKALGLQAAANRFNLSIPPATVVPELENLYKLVELEAPMIKSLRYITYDQTKAFREGGYADYIKLMEK